MKRTMPFFPVQKMDRRARVIIAEAQHPGNPIALSLHPRQGGRYARSHGARTYSLNLVNTFAYCGHHREMKGPCRDK
jgi:hypothetical protein